MKLYTAFDIDMLVAGNCILMSVDTVADAFDPVIVTVYVPLGPLYVPVISPVLLLIDSPAGSPLADQLVIVPLYAGVKLKLAPVFCWKT